MQRTACAHFSLAVAGSHGSMSFALNHCACARARTSASRASKSYESKHSLSADDAMTTAARSRRVYVEDAALARCLVQHKPQVLNYTTTINECSRVSALQHRQHACFPVQAGGAHRQLPFSQAPANTMQANYLPLNRSPLSATKYGWIYAINSRLLHCTGYRHSRHSAAHSPYAGAVQRDQFISRQQLGAALAATGVRWLSKTLATWWSVRGGARCLRACWGKHPTLG